MNDGSAGKEYYMSPTLMTFVKNSNAAMRNAEKAKKREEEGVEMEELRT